MYCPQGAAGLQGLWTLCSPSLAGLHTQYTSPSRAGSGFPIEPPTRPPTHRTPPPSRPHPALDPAPWPAVGHGGEVLSGLKWVTQLVHDTSELVVIVFIAWTAMSFKNRVLHWLTHGVLAGRCAAKGRSRGQGGEGSEGRGGAGGGGVGGDDGSSTGGSLWPVRRCMRAFNMQLVCSC